MSDVGEIQEIKIINYNGRTYNIISFSVFFFLTADQVKFVFLFGNPRYRLLPISSSMMNSKIIANCVKFVRIQIIKNVKIQYYDLFILIVYKCSSLRSTSYVIASSSVFAVINISITHIHTYNIYISIMHILCENN